MTAKKAPVKKATAAKPPKPSPPTMDQVFALVQQQTTNIDRLFEILGKVCSTVYNDSRPEPGPEVNTCSAVASVTKSRVADRVGNMNVSHSYAIHQMNDAEDLLNQLVDRLTPVMSNQPRPENTAAMATPDAICEYGDRLVTLGNRSARIRNILADVLERLEV